MIHFITCLLFLIFQKPGHDVFCTVLSAAADVEDVFFHECFDRTAIGFFMSEYFFYTVSDVRYF